MARKKRKRKASNPKRHWKRRNVDDDVVLEENESVDTSPVSHAGKVGNMADTTMNNEHEVFTPQSTDRSGSSSSSSYMSSSPSLQPNVIYTMGPPPPMFAMPHPAMHVLPGWPSYWHASRVLNAV